jgi:hypothetical protein
VVKEEPQRPAVARSAALSLSAVVALRVVWDPARDDRRLDVQNRCDEAAQEGGQRRVARKDQQALGLSL